MLISIENHITCDYRGGGVWTPYPPLDLHVNKAYQSKLVDERADVTCPEWREKG